MDNSEIWKTIEGFENYEVSDHGRLRSKRTQKFLNGYVQWGRRAIALRKENKKWERRLALLVAKSFIPNPENKDYVYHANKDLLNCRADNLYWISSMEIQKMDSVQIKKNSVLKELETIFPYIYLD